jgi:predicted nucleotidyltransferase
MGTDAEKLQFGLKERTLERIRGVFSGYPQVRQVIIYGSRAKGNYRNGSDIDLTIVGDTITLSELMKIENELDDLLLPYKIDLSLLHKINEASLIDHVDRVGIVIYDSENRN